MKAGMEESNQTFARLHVAALVQSCAKKRVQLLIRTTFRIRLASAAIIQRRIVPRACSFSSDSCRQLHQTLHCAWGGRRALVELQPRDLHFPQFPPWLKSCMGGKRHLVIVCYAHILFNFVIDRDSLCNAKKYCGHIIVHFGNRETQSSRFSEEYSFLLAFSFKESYVQ